MKPSATGRILLWRGGSLWIGLAGEPARVHSHHAVQITLPFAKDGVRFRLPNGDWKSFPAAVVAAHQPHAFDAHEQYVAQIFVEPESIAGRELQRQYHDVGISSLTSDVIRQPISSLAAAYERRATDAELISLALTAIARIAGTVSPQTKPPDPRITAAVELIRGQLSEAVTLTSAAAAAHLSPDRFRHLFIEETGVTFRAYVLWLRLEFSLGAFVGGRTLTEAAYAGGFADSAHFSRTFRRMFGIAPASVRPE